MALASIWVAGEGVHRLQRRLARSLTILAVLVGALSVGPSGAKAQMPPPDTDPPQVEKKPGSAAAGPCSKYGPDAWAVGGLGVCARHRLLIGTSAFKEFTDQDIIMVGQRIPTPFQPGNGIPVVYYYKKDVRPQTDHMSYAGFGVVDLSLVPADNPRVRGRVTAVFEGRRRYDEDGDARYVTSPLNSVYDMYNGGTLYEAWVQLYGLKIGKQESMFGFRRPPSIVRPLYSSVMTTTAVSYTLRPLPNLSLSVSAEDGSRRNLSDGVLAREKWARSKPDLVGMVRFAHLGTLVHVSGAIHRAEDEVNNVFGVSPDENPETKGWAVSAGLERLVDWSAIFGTNSVPARGRVRLAGAYTKGAIGYLGVPLFAPNYIMRNDGQPSYSEGWSGIVSYEHIWAKSLKSTLSLSVFGLSMSGGIPEVLVPTAPGFSFDTHVKGAVVQLGVEKIIFDKTIVGVEVGYTWTAAEGTYLGSPSREETVGFPHVGVAVKQAF